MKRPLAALTEPLLFKLFRHTVPKGHDLTLERHRIYALPTRYGLLYAAMLAVMLLGSINYNNSLGFLLTFLLAGLGIISILYTYRNIAHLQIRSGKTAPVFAGKEARFIVHLHNPDPLPRYALQVTAAGGEPVFADIAANGAASVELPMAALRRGRLSLGRVTLATAYPLGLVRAWAYVNPDMHCLVYPRPGPHHPTVAIPHDARGDQAGLAAGSDDFAGFRAYHPGDSLRRIHWKALARALPLMTKKFAASAGPDLWLEWEALPGLDNEARLRILCRLVLEAARGTQAYGLRLPSGEIPPTHGAIHQHRCLEALALFGEARP